jgi:hypothetical protein
MSSLPLPQILFLVATVGAFTLFGLTLAFCRAVSKDLPK